MGNNISLYNRVGNVNSEDSIPFDIFLENIRNGHWQDKVLAIRLIKEPEKRLQAKKRVPCVTISGLFSKRADDSIVHHSGYIGIDIDNCDPEEVKEVLSKDRYIVAAFTSISGRGLCVIIKVKPAKHKEAFQGFCEYLYNNYEIIADPTSINPSRARFVSFDPAIYIADVADTFTQYPKYKPPKKVDKVIFAPDDFQDVLKQIVARQLNIAENYYEWLRIAFGLIQKFGEAGREYFHIISQYSRKYDAQTCDKQYDACLKHKGRDKETTISTIYYYAKEAGCEIYSERTKTIANTAKHGKKSGLKPEQIADNLRNFEQIEGEDVMDIIKQVYDHGIEINEDTLFDELEMFVRHNYDLRRNEITRYIENKGKILHQKDLNTIYIKAKKVLEKINYEYVDRLINSDFVITYNPLKEYLSKLENPLAGDVQEQLILTLKNGPHLPYSNVIQLIEQHFPCVRTLFQSITTTDPDYLLYFGSKWLVSMISSIYGQHSPLMLVLSGAIQNTGKTEWFRRLLPDELKPYYAESKLDRDKDDEILMTQKLIIMDDEMGGKSKRENNKLKTLTSAQYFSLREPYGRNNVDLLRLALLCGTTNTNELLYDSTGNRRIIPIPVTYINHDMYNSVNKTDLMAEVNALYNVGLRWRFTKEDVEYVNRDKEEFEVLNMEAELITKYFAPGGSNRLTATDIKVYIENKTNQRLILDRIGKELKRLGFEQKMTRVGNSIQRIYAVTYRLDENIPPAANNAQEDDDLPF